MSFANGLNLDTASLIFTTGSYADPSWLTSLNGSKLTGTVTANAITAGTYNISISGTSAGAPPTGSAGGDLTGTFPNPTIANSAVTNAKISNSTIDLTAKVTGLLPFANGGLGFSTATLGDLFYASATNTPGKLSDVALGSVVISGGVGAAPSYSSSPTLTGLTLSGLSASYPLATDASKNLVSTNTASRYPFGSSNPTVDSNVDTAINLISNSSSNSAQLNVASTALNQFLILWSGRTADTNSAIMWSSTSDLRYGTSTAGALTTAGFIELFKMRANGDFNIASGNLVMSSATRGFTLKSVSVSGGVANGLCVTSVTLSGGTSGTITNSSVTTNHKGQAFLQTASGTIGSWRVSCAAGSFTVNSTNVSDNSVLVVTFFLPN